MKHELWFSEKESAYTFCLSGKYGEQQRKMLEPDSKLIWTCDAESWFEACTKMYEYLDWGKYKIDHPELDKQTYVEQGKI